MRRLTNISALKSNVAFSRRLDTSLDDDAELDREDDDSAVTKEEPEIIEELAREDVDPVESAEISIVFVGLGVVGRFTEVAASLEGTIIPTASKADETSFPTESPGTL